MKRNIFLILKIKILLILSLICVACESNPNNQIVNMVDNIDSIPVSISFQNKLHVNNNGGHLQGIQYYQYEQQEYLFLTGSSDSNSYYTVVKMGEENSVISVNNILSIPYKHAGGFQISNNLMAIGVEDNSERNRSKVFIYSIDNPEKLPTEPLEIVNRVGTVDRATAGCVGITVIGDYILMVVGDWDTEHFDFYKMKKENIGLDSETFDLEYSVNLDRLDKSEWIDDSWLSYQNINIIQDDAANLYLAGMASNNNGDNILDIFKIETEDLSAFKLSKIYTKKFPQSEYSNFDWGAGVYVSNDGMLKVFSCGNHIQDVTMVNIFE